MIASDASKKAMEINYLVKLGRMLTNVNVKTWKNLTFFTGRMLRITKVRTYQNLTFTTS